MSAFDWFRSWHGAPADTKLALVAIHSKQPRAFVTAVWWEVLDHASRNVPRGHAPSQNHYEQIAFQQGITIDQVASIIASMNTKGMIREGQIVAWGKYQVRREDPQAAERKRKERERSKSDSHTPSHTVTQCHAPSQNVLIDTEKKREEKKEGEPPYPLAFKTFWTTYPKNGASKTQTFKSWQRATQAESAETILNAIPAYVGFLRATETPIAHATTWLNQQRWTVDHAALAEGKKPSHRKTAGEIERQSKSNVMTL